MPWRSEPQTAADVAALQGNRAQAELRLAARSDGPATRLADLCEGGGYRIKFPQAERGLEAVIVNTGGGLLGGDTLSIDVRAEAGAEVMVTTQSAEKIYRAVAAPAHIDIALQAEAGARLHWLPQEAILFSGARLTRRIEADVAEGAELIVAEAAVFGRLAMGEVLREGLLADRWRIRRGGTLVHADDLRLDGHIAGMLDRPAIGGGSRASASIVVLAPDAEARLDQTRALAEDDAVSSGASAWDGKLVVRLLAADPEPLRKVFSRLLANLSDRSLPRFW